MILILAKSATGPRRPNFYSTESNIKALEGNNNMNKRPVSAVYIEKHRQVPTESTNTIAVNKDIKANNRVKNGNDSSISDESSNENNNWSERLRNFTQKKQVRQYSATTSNFI